MSKKNGKIGTFGNHKGGTGKTTATVHLAASLAIKKKKILIIDNDPQCNATNWVIPNNTPIRNSLYQLIDPDEENRPNIKDCIYPTIHPNLYILPNIPETTGLEIPLTKLHPDSNLMLRHSIRDYATDNFDFTFIDCPPSLAILVSNALHASDFLIVMMSAESGYSLEGVLGVLDLMEAVQMDGNPDLKFLKVLINRVDKRYGAHKANIQNANDRFGKENIFKTTIPTCSIFQSLEVVQHATVFSSKKGLASRGSAAFRKLSMEFLSFFED